jgi:hypothetical protein
MNQIVDNVFFVVINMLVIMIMSALYCMGVLALLYWLESEAAAVKLKQLANQI